MMWQRVLNTLWSSFQSLLDNLLRHFREGCLINKKRGNLFAIPFDKLKLVLNVQEASDGFINHQRFFSYVCSIKPYYLIS
jgi:hypothetical protein